MGGMKMIGFLILGEKIKIKPKKDLKNILKLPNFIYHTKIYILYYLVMMVKFALIKDI
jgi:hypothetical protein